MTWTYTDEMYKEYTRTTWNESADRYDPFLPNLALYDPPLFEAARIGAGAERGLRVLDVGTGPGEPALTVAGMVADGGGTVVGVDLSERMVERARRRAREAGVENASFEVMDAEELTFDDGAFDRVLSRFGMQLLTDPEAGFAEAHRVLKEGGRFATTVWASPGERVPVIHVIIGPMLDFAEPDETGYLPTPYEMGGDGEMTEMLEAAGFDEVGETTFTATQGFESAEAFLAAMLEGTPVGHSLAEEAEDVQKEVLARTRKNIAAWVQDDGRVRVPGEAVVASGTR